MHTVAPCARARRPHVKAPLQGVGGVGGGGGGGGGGWHDGVHSHLRRKLVVVHQQQAACGARPVRSCDAMHENRAPRFDSPVHKVEERLEEVKDGLGRAARV